MEESESDENETMLHPNLIQLPSSVGLAISAEGGKSVRSTMTHNKERLGCFHRFYKIDESILKPALIYKYNKKKASETRELFYDLSDNLAKMEAEFLQSKGED